jgi:UDP-glucose 4-epimerase
VYSPEERLPWDEKDYIWNTTNPYWTTKLIIENILRDLSNHKWFNVINLRYFNPIWAHESWLIWENPSGIPNNLLPFVMKVAIWDLDKVKVFWNDYNTNDWTWERDYIHVVDLIDWHIKALKYIENEGKDGLYEEVNLWTWKATSVLDIIKYTKRVTGIDINYKIEWRREWDLPRFYCNPEKAKKLLNWEAKYDIKQGIKDSWNFIKNNVN